MNSSRCPLASVKVPLLVPPPARLRTPLLTLTVPVLLKVGSISVVPVPAGLVLVKVPALEKVASPMRFASCLRY
jgi:hypothetical protein